MTDRPGQALPSTVVVTAPDPALEPPPAVPDDPSLDQVRALCPHLVASDGDWRSIAPAREHACAAVDPPAPVAVDKQRRLCLVDAHVDCATYRAARQALVVDDAEAGATPPEPPAPLAGRWPVPRTTTVVIDRGGGGLSSLRLDRSVAQLGLVALMVLAFSVLAVARLTSDGAGMAGRSAAPSGGQATAPVAPASATPSVSPAPSPQPSPSNASSSSPSAAASPSPAASVTTYRVRLGDTLTGIAARFGTTVAVLRELNDIANPSLLRVGQILRLP